jgi:cytochrome c oxidase cbb3-type subunit 2
MRTGPDLANIAVRQPSRMWHYVHLYQPRAVAPGSVMPSFPFLFEVKDRAEPNDEELDLPQAYAPDADRVVIATEDARRLVDYLLSLNRNFPRADARQMRGGH